VIQITKKDTPKSLLLYKKQPNAKYDGDSYQVDDAMLTFTAVKAEIRTYLLQEQGYICAYCMKRIMDNQLTTKVEHWHSQNRYNNEQLEYKNMLAVCCGKTQNCNHCDGKKSQFDNTHDLLYNPSESKHHIESKIEYSTTGRVKSNDIVFNEQLNSMLGLNCSRLIENRKAVIESVQIGLSKKSGTRTVNEIRIEIDKWSSVDHDGCKKEYCGVALFILHKKSKQPVKLNK
jgi:uncharacterized protein (TIGR02646 family)